MGVRMVQRAGVRAEYDSDADALYIHLRERSYSHGKDLDEARRVDYGSDGAPIGVELLSPAVIGVSLDGLPNAQLISAIAQDLGLAVGYGTLSRGGAFGGGRGGIDIIGSGTDGT